MITERKLLTFDVELQILNFSLTLTLLLEKENMIFKQVKFLKLEKREKERRMGKKESRKEQTT